MLKTINRRISADIFEFASLFGLIGNPMKETWSKIIFSSNKFLDLYIFEARGPPIRGLKPTAGSKLNSDLSPRVEKTLALWEAKLAF